MSVFRIIIIGLLLSAFTSCNSLKNYSNALDYAVNSSDKTLQNVFESADKYQVQILFAEIERINNTINLKEHSYRLDNHNYFYPASTVKFPIAVLALEQLNQMSISHKSTFKLINDTIPTSFKKTIKDIFAISDNQAFNRLYEFIGKDNINSRIHSKGIQQFRIAHRLSTTNANRLERTSLIINPNQNKEVLINFNPDTPSIPLELSNLTKGSGHLFGESTIYEPFDFSLKNYYPISSQYEVLKRVIFPELYSKEQQFNINSEQRKFLLKSMRSLPREVGYHPKEYYDSYGKFFLFGDSKKHIPKKFKIYNKVGYAYGTLTDCAYIINSKTNVEFILITTILVNENQIFNDNLYQYDEIGIPFLSALGKEIYRYQKRTRRNKTN